MERIGQGGANLGKTFIEQALIGFPDRRFLRVWGDCAKSFALRALRVRGV
jgi:hypothetical protein